MNYQQAIPINDKIYWIGVNDRSTHRFEGLWPLPCGVSYNSYLINDDKVALIDTVKYGSSQEFIDKIKSVIGDKKVDYLIVNHMEPDHSGSIQTLLNIYPELVIVGNAKTANFLKQFFNITDNIHLVEDGDVLELGQQHLQFFMTPMVHWPETMMTYDPETKMLFSGDAFGGFGALGGGIFDDEVDIKYYEDEILRYFSNIVGKYCITVQKAISKLSGLDVQMIGSTHGVVWRKDVKGIIDRYNRWSRHESSEGVMVAYGSMYGNTEKMMDAVLKGISNCNISDVRVHNVAYSHLSYLIRDAWKYKGIVLGAPTYDMKLFPPMDQLIRMLEHKQLKNRVIGIFGTYGWSGGGVSSIEAFAKSVNWEMAAPAIEAHCAPTDDDLKKCVELGQSFQSVMNA